MEKQKISLKQPCLMPFQQDGVNFGQVYHILGDSHLSQWLIYLLRRGTDQFDQKHKTISNDANKFPQTSISNDYLTTFCKEMAGSLKNLLNLITLIVFDLSCFILNCHLLINASIKAKSPLLSSIFILYEFAMLIAILRDGQDLNYSLLVYDKTFFLIINLHLALNQGRRRTDYTTYLVDLFINLRLINSPTTLFTPKGKTKDTYIFIFASKRLCLFCLIRSLIVLTSTEGQ